MQEFIRLQHIRRSIGPGNELRDYNICIFKGEIIYVQGIGGCGKSLLEKILTGQEHPQEGNIYYKGKLADPIKLGSTLHSRIYTMGMKYPLVKQMTILDNLETIRNVPFPLRPYCRERAFANAQQVLKELKITASPKAKLRELSFLEEQKLCLAKLVAAGAQMIIISCVYNVYSDRDMRILGQYIKEYSKRGISFLFLSEKPNPFMEIADRFQIMHRGIDLMEWKKGEQESSLLRDYSSEAGIRIKEEPWQSLGKVICLLDFKWDGAEFGEKYLRIFRKNNPQLWKEFIDIEIIKSGRIFDGYTAVIPQGSGECLPENLSLEDNLSLCIPGRAGRGIFNILNSRAREVLKKDFLKVIGRKGEVSELRQLNLGELKVLSIYRWELAKPKVLLLDNPFWGMDIPDTEFLNDYLKRLKRKDIKVIVFSRFLEKVTDCYDMIITAEAGKNARFL